jgi:hypothetical protein
MNAISHCEYVAGDINIGKIQVTKLSNKNKQ